jgi:hypothetical protein
MKSAAWCEHMMVHVMFDGDRQKAGDYIRAQKRIEPDPRIRGRRAFAAIVDDISFIPFCNEAMPELSSDVL